MTNPHLDEAHLKDYARIDVRNMLGAVPGCVAPVVIGGKDRTVLIYLKPDALQPRHLSPVDVVLRVGERQPDGYAGDRVPRQGPARCSTRTQWWTRSRS